MLACTKKERTHTPKQHHIIHKLVSYATRYIRLYVCIQRKIYLTTWEIARAIQNKLQENTLLNCYFLSKSSKILKNKVYIINL